VSPQISGRGREGQSGKRSPTFLTHIDAIAGFTSQSLGLGLPAYACKTGGSTSTTIKLAPRMHQNVPF